MQSVFAACIMASKEREAMKCPDCGSANIVVQDHSDHSSYYLHNADSKLGFFLAWLMRNAYRSEYGEMCICNDCDSRWYSKRTAIRQRYRELLEERFRTVRPKVKMRAPDNGFLEINTHEVTLFHSDGRTYKVAFDELAAVSFQKSLGPLYGWLSIRDRAHAKRRLPWNFKQAKKDRYTVFCDFSDEAACYEVYLALQKIVEENKKAGLI